MSEGLFTIESPEFARAVRVLDAANVNRTLQKPIGAALTASGNVVRKNVREQAKAHRQTGNMARNRMRIKSRGSGTGRVVKFSALSPANLIVGGVRPHSISPGKVMPIRTGRGKFGLGRSNLGSGRGVTGFASAVESPGFHGDPFVARGIHDSMKEINRLLDAAGELVVRELAASIRGGF